MPPYLAYVCVFAYCAQRHIYSVTALKSVIFSPYIEVLLLSAFNVCVWKLVASLSWSYLTKIFCAPVKNVNFLELVFTTSRGAFLVSISKNAMLKWHRITLCFYLQGECWFNPKIPVETSLKESTPFNGSEILKERLKKLEENTQLFSRGCVYKNNAMTFNRQPDYEFFLTRKS